jgi:NAD(P)-dependent dehydrogenase (short-subunit alcohol dehydrogenase family)
MPGERNSRAAGMRRLTDKVCVITGAGQGIGRATARRLGDEGGKIVVADRIDASASAAVAELRGSGVEVTKTLVDVSTFDGARELMRATQAAYGRIDVLVNKSGSNLTIFTLKMKSNSSSSARSIRRCGVVLLHCRS